MQFKLFNSFFVVVVDFPVRPVRITSCNALHCVAQLMQENCFLKNVAVKFGVVNERARQRAGRQALCACDTLCSM